MYVSLNQVTLLLGSNSFVDTTMITKKKNLILSITENSRLDIMLNQS